MKVRIVNTANNHRNDISAIILLFVLWVFFFWQLITPIAEDKIIIQPNGDFGGQFYNFSSYQAQRLSEEKQLPLWNPYNLGGSPFLDPQQANAYPMRWLSMLFSSSKWSYFSLELEVMFHYLLASILMYVFARRITGYPLGGLVAAVIFAYGAALTDFPMQQTSILLSSVWLPGILLGLHEGVHPGANWRWYVVGGIFLGLSIAAGHPQMSLYFAMFSLIYLIFRGYSQGLRWREGIAGIFVFLMTSAGISAMSWLPTYDFFRFATRSDDFNYATKSGGYFLHNMWQVLWTAHDQPSYWYTGVLVLFLGGLAVLVSRKESLFWLFSAAVCFVIGFGSKTVAFRLFYVFVPGFSAFRNPERIIIVWSFCTAALAGIGAVALVRRVDQEHMPALYKILAGLGAVAGVYFVLAYIRGDLAEREAAAYVFLLTIFMGASIPYIFHNRVLAGQALLVGLVIFDVFSVTQGRSYNHVYGDPGEMLSQKAAPPWVTDIYPLLENSSYARIDSGGKIGAFGTLYRLPDIQGTGTLKLKTTVSVGALPLEKRWDLFSVRYVYSEESLPADIATPLPESYRDYAGVPFRIYDLASPRPVARMIYEVDVVFSDDHALAVLAAPDYPIRDRIVLHEYPQISLNDTQPDDEAAITVQSFDPEHISITADTSQSGILSLSVPYHSGWSARVNSDQVEILRVNVGFMGIPLEPGEHDIELTFGPKSFIYGRACTIVAWTLVLGVLLSWLRKRRPGTISN